MNHYYIYHPRNFGNEYTVYVVANDDDDERLWAVLPDAERITRQEAIYAGVSAPHAAMRDDRYWDGGFASTGSDLPDRTAASYITDCIHATREFIVDAERVQQQEQEYLA